MSTRRISTVAAVFLFASGVHVNVDAFAPSRPTFNPSTTSIASTVAEEEISVDPKEAVKLFGRLAEKYIMLDDSGGMCCYSACSDCEFRLPGGGYRMADQSSSRAKWIPVYEQLKFESQGKEHTSKWSTDIFTDGPAISKEEFVAKVTNELAYQPCLGGPYLAASGAAIEDNYLAEKLFAILAGEKEKLTRNRMSARLKEIAGGEQALTWPAFLAVLSEA